MLKMSCFFSGYGWQGLSCVAQQQRGGRHLGGRGDVVAVDSSGVHLHQVEDGARRKSTEGGRLLTRPDLGTRHWIPHFDMRIFHLMVVALESKATGDKLQLDGEDQSG
jgi:hypothetical protein